MLHVTPVKVQVDEIVRRSIKMFENELAADKITTIFEIGQSYREAKIDQVFCDPVRLTQIFINLLTNVSSAFAFVLVIVEPNIFRPSNLQELRRTVGFL